MKYISYQTYSFCLRQAAAAAAAVVLEILRKGF
jgi:hypothetical protein